MTGEGLSLSLKEEAVLIVLQRGEMYGLALMETIEGASDFHISLAIGSLYPLLRRLEKDGFVLSRKEDARLDRRKGNKRTYYAITSKGCLALYNRARLRDRLCDWPLTT